MSTKDSPSTEPLPQCTLVDGAPTREVLTSALGLPPDATNEEIIAADRAACSRVLDQQAAGSMTGANVLLAEYAAEE